MKLLKHVGLCVIHSFFPKPWKSATIFRKKGGSFLDHKPLQSLQLTIKDGKTRYNQPIKNSGQGLPGQPKKHPSPPPKKTRHPGSRPSKNGSSFARFFFLLIGDFQLVQLKIGEISFHCFAAALDLSS